MLSPVIIGRHYSQIVVNNTVKAYLLVSTAKIQKISFATSSVSLLFYFACFQEKNCWKSVICCTFVASIILLPLTCLMLLDDGLYRAG